MLGSRPKSRGSVRDAAPLVELIADQLPQTAQVVSAIDGVKVFLRVKPLYVFKADKRERLRLPARDGRRGIVRDAIDQGAQRATSLEVFEA